MNNNTLAWVNYVKYAIVFIMAAILWCFNHSCAYCGDVHAACDVSDSNYGYVCDSCYDLIETDNLDMSM